MKKTKEERVKFATRIVERDGLKFYDDDDREKYYKDHEKQIHETKQKLILSYQLLKKLRKSRGDVQRVIKELIALNQNIVIQVKRNLSLHHGFMFCNVCGGAADDDNEGQIKYLYCASHGYQHIKCNKYGALCCSFC